MNVLLIGNSYTYYNDMPALLQKLCNENKKTARVYSVTKGGRKLWENLDPADETTAELHALLQRTKMDFCFLQEHSVLPVVEFEKFRTAVKDLCETLSPDVSRFLLYQTWGRKEGHPFLSQSGLTNQTMTEGLADAYAAVAEELSLRVSPVGACFYQIHTSHKELDLYDPDLTHPSYTGSCLAALTHYRTLFNELPGSLHCLDLPAQTEELLRQTVSENQ